jgi:myo-inositol 2-dehydrogenase/D-chiro-inositol 1-dehydrogenase
MGKLRIGLVGLSQGWYAKLYSRFCASHKDVEFIGVCDLGVSDDYTLATAEITARQFADELEVPVYHSFEDLMAQDPGALIITCETRDHHHYVIPAVKAGVHCIVGKPLTCTLAAAQEVAKVVSEHESVIVLPGQPARYEDGLMEARKKVMSGSIGKPLMTHLLINHPTMTNHEWQMRFDRSGGPFVEFGTYVADLAEWIVGSPIKSVYARGNNFLYPGVDGPDNAKLLCEHDNGTLSSLDIHCSITWNYPFLGLEIIGEKASLRANYHNYTLMIQGNNHYELGDTRLSPMNQREIEHFLDCVLHHQTPIITPQDHVSTIAVIESAIKSMQSDQPELVIRGEA